MKVLKSKAENDQLEAMEISCTGQGIHNTRTPCGSLLEINALDVHSDFSSDYGGSTDQYYYRIHSKKAPIFMCGDELLNIND